MQLQSEQPEEGTTDKKIAFVEETINKFKNGRISITESL